jgi:hypothetical protein
VPVDVLHIGVIYLCAENLGNSFNTHLTNFASGLSIIVNSHPDDVFSIR